LKRTVTSYREQILEPAPNEIAGTSGAKTALRALYAFDNWLFFVAGGLAIADLDFHEGGAAFGPTGGKYVGWSIGGGVERAFTRNLVGRIEYLYDDYGHKDYIGVAGDLYRVSLTGQTLRGAMIWKFDTAGMKP
jgi:outer membrane immunogenic protein